jgi:hypothetical protein
MSSQNKLPEGLTVKASFAEVVYLVSLSKSESLVQVSL